MYCKILNKKAGGGGTMGVQQSAYPGSVKSIWLRLCVIHVCRVSIQCEVTWEIGVGSPAIDERGKATSPAQLPNLILPICSNRDSNLPPNSLLGMFFHL